MLFIFWGGRSPQTATVWDLLVEKIIVSSFDSTQIQVFSYNTSKLLFAFPMDRITFLIKKQSLHNVYQIFKQIFVFVLICLCSAIYPLSANPLK